MVNMDDKEDTFVEHLAKNLILEQVAVSGILYVTVDDKLLTKHRFKDCIKVQIAFDKSASDQKESNQLSGDEVDENSAKAIDSMKDEDDLIDEALRMKFDASSGSQDTFYSKEAETTFADEESCIQRKRRKTVKSQKRIATSKSKSQLSVTKKRLASKRALTKNVKSKEISYSSDGSKVDQRKEIETAKIEFAEDDNDSDDQDNDSSNEHKTEVKSEDDNSDADPNNVISCPYCDRTFKNQNKFAQHRKVQRQHYPCSKCHRVLKYKAYLMIHMRDHHQEKKPKENHPDGKREQCDICGSFFSRVSNLKNHLMTHTNEYHFQCCVCPQQILLAQGYERHMATHSKTNRGTIQCTICKIRVNTRSELAKHKLTHPHPCGLCGKEFSNKTGRYFHYKTAHKDDILKCPLCDRLYSDKKALGRHLKHHRNRHQTQCPVCGLFFFRLPEHMLSSHPAAKADGEPVDNTVFVCDKCPKQFTKKKSFEEHLKIHVEEKPYRCSECSKQFALSKGLSRHMAVHLQEKPYVCNVCGKACSQKGNLRVHMRVHEADKAPKVLHCNHCGATFPHKNALQEHMDKEHRVEGNVLQFPQQYFQMNTFYHG